MIRRLYGDGLLHLLAHLVAFVIAAWALHQILEGGFIINYVVWFVGAAVLHDLIALPLYSLLDRAAGTGARRVLGEQGRAALNHVRVPTIISAILLLVYFPVILGYSARNYRSDTGHPLHGYLRNWLLITAGLYLASAIAFAIGQLRRRRIAPPPPAMAQNDTPA